MKCRLAYSVFLVFALSLSCSAQQFALYNTRTLYDAFENSSQKAFYADSSRKFAFNFFIPTIGFNGIFTGPAQTSLKRLITKGGFSANGLNINDTENNSFYGNLNTYVIMFRLFRSLTLNQEIGLSWQVKGESTISDFTNPTFALLQDYRYFNDGITSDIFNNKAYAQSYHQIGLTYRRDLNKKIGLGAKLSYLSGITYNRFQIDNSSITKQSETNSYNLFLKGRVLSSFNIKSPEEISSGPGFTNPGVALTASANFKFRGGWFLLANLKDIGFIHWGSDSYQYSLNNNIFVDSADINRGSKYVFEKVKNTLNQSFERAPFNSMINGKAEILVNKDFNHYQPDLLVSKNLFYRGFDVALTNTYKTENFRFSVSTAYSFDNFQLGGLAMYKTPNAEFFIGTDNVLKTYYTTKGLITRDENIGKGYTAASVYIGFGLKFGRVVEHPTNTTDIRY